MDRVSGTLALHVERCGSGPRTVLLIHGFADHIGTRHRVVAALAEQGRMTHREAPNDTPEPANPGQPQVPKPHHPAGLTPIILCRKGTLANPSLNH